VDEKDATTLTASGSETTVTITATTTTTAAAAAAAAESDDDDDDDDVDELSSSDVSSFADVKHNNNLTSSTDDNIADYRWAGHTHRHTQKEREGGW